MILSVFERLILLNILPTNGDILTIRTKRKLREDLSFSEGEHQSLQFKRTYECSECGETAEIPSTEVRSPRCEKCDRQMVPAAGIQWLTDGNQEKDVKIDTTGRKIVESTLLQLNDEKLLTEEHLSLYEKFVEGS